MTFHRYKKLAENISQFCVSPFHLGAVLGAALALIGSYLVGVQRKYEVILSEIIEGDLVAAWSNPTTEMHKAAETIQCCFR